MNGKDRWNEKGVTERINKWQERRKEQMNDLNEINVG